MEESKKKNKLDNNLLFQQDNASCHKSRKTLEALEVIFGDDKIWWPVNSPDLSPIETVWAILKQELSKKKNTTLDELRSNIIDIWCKFPNELCEKIISEFDEKIEICKKENGHIINKITLRKYQKQKKIETSFYDWVSFKREKNYRIAYNDKIIGIIQKKLCKNIKSIKKEKIRQFKLDKPKANKKTRLLGKIKINYKEYNKNRDSQIKEIDDAYE